MQENSPNLANFIQSLTRLMVWGGGGWFDEGLGCRAQDLRVESRRLALKV